MATKKFSDLTTTSTPNSASVFAIAYDSANYGVTLSNIAANLPATTATSLTSSGTLTTSGNATIGGDLTISGDDLFMGTNTSGAALIADGTNFNPVVISGDIAIATNGAATIQADAVEGSMLNDNVISGQTEISSGLADADELLYSDAGTLKKVGMDTMKTYFSPVAGSSSIVTTGTIASGTWEATDVAVAHGGTGASTLTANGVLIGNGTSAITAVDLSTKGKILIGDGSGNPSALTVGSNNHVLTADSSEGTGIKWAAIPASTPTDITVADESTDTSCFPLFVTAATGDLGPKTASGLTFNSNTDVLSGTFSGNITGNVTGNTSGSSGSCTGNSATATTSTNVTVADESSDTTCFPVFVTAATGDLAPKSGSNLAFNSSSGVLTATGFAGDITGNVTGNASGSAGSCTGNSATATTSTNVTVADESSDTTCFPLFVTAATGDLGPKSGSNLAFNSSSGVLTATGFAGDITGNVTGNTSGTSGSTTGNAATATALATARNIGGVSFDGTGNIDLPGVNAAGSQNTSGTAAGLSSTLAVSSGGTGATSLTANGVIIGNGTSALTAVDLSTKGKILIGDGSGNPQALAVGTNNYLLTADSSEATGVKWAAAAGGGGGLEVLSAVNEYNASANTTSYSYTGFDSDYDNYYVIIHGISQAGDGDLQLRFLDDGSAITVSDYRQSTLGITYNLSEKRITTEAADKFTLVEQQKGGDKDPMSGFMYFNNPAGGRWDSDSNDSKGQISPSVVYQLGGEGSNGSSRIAIGHGYINDTQANTCNGFQLLFAGGTGASKINMTIYGVKRS